MSGIFDGIAPDPVVVRALVGDKHAEELLRSAYGDGATAASIRLEADEDLENDDDD